MDLTSSSRKREKNMQWSVFFSPHKWRSEDTGDKEQTFNIKLFNLHPRKSTEQDIAKPKKELRLGGSHDNLCFIDIFCCIKLSRPFKKKISDRQWQKLLAFWAWVWKKLRPLAVPFSYPLWIRKVRGDTVYLGQQTTFCSFLKPACDKNAFIHWMSSDGFFWANFGF